MAKPMLEEMVTVRRAAFVGRALDSLEASFAYNYNAGVADGIEVIPRALEGHMEELERRVQKAIAEGVLDE